VRRDYRIPERDIILVQGTWSRKKNVKRFAREKVVCRVVVRDKSNKTKIDMYVISSICSREERWTKDKMNKMDMR
jgi:uncharacterized protein YggU (UPF0235/DUF167 family)